MIHIIDMSGLNAKERRRFNKLLENVDGFCSYEKDRLFGKQIIWSETDAMEETLDVSAINCVMDNKDGLDEQDLTAIKELKELKQLLGKCKSKYLGD